ncbi:carbohydrate ABC transporter permease [Nonomuraea gerenzanensis]|uniref:Inner membrane ABC transporter permease protein YcjO n=1 Tax=Nonomuraea gerenzanensis TaxID=93944 RepID=A0A1M4E1Y0_9ACTN|nr:sugar ABC transporter permease [Nonomuraea gerenzanensis]UBU15067.1 sugar ABC transporter permease [Nonomuraea gerenzanensis]SBO92812.1 Inner membrane ABC transporter permease protein YcjO [Nonomuraea gerenzanensis]
MTGQSAPPRPRRAAPPPRRRRRGRTLREQEARAGLLLISPTLIITLVVVVLPLLWAIMLAFQSVRLINIRRTGVFGQYTLENFTYVISEPGFWTSLANTLVYTVAGTGLSIVFGLVAALALRERFMGRTLIRASILIPYVAPVVAVTFLWETMLNPQYGIVNTWLSEPIAFLTQAQGDFLGFKIPVALLTVILFEAWRYFPFAFLFILARLQAMPADLEEAAVVDGAAPTQLFRYVILPQLWSVIALLAVLRFVFTFTKFDDVYLLTGGGAGTEVVSVRVYNFLTSRDDIGAAAAQAIVLAVFLVVFLVIYLRFFAGGEREQR